MAMHSMRNLAFWPFCADSAIYPVISISLLFMVYSESKPPFLPSIRGRLAGPRHKKRADLGGGQRCPLDVATVLSRPSAAVGVPMQHDMFRGPLPAKVRPARLSELSMDPPTAERGCIPARMPTAAAPSSRAEERFHHPSLPSSSLHFSSWLFDGGAC